MYDEYGEPYPYTLEQWGVTLEGLGGFAWTMDWRHSFLLLEYARLHPFNRVLEIGCYQGGSAIPLLEAQKYHAERGHHMHLYHCDVQISEQLDVLLAPYVEKGTSEILMMQSTDALQQYGPFDLVFVDGDHTLPTVKAETQLLLEQQTLCVVAHDTTCGLYEHDAYNAAPWYLKHRFMATAPYLCLEECCYREPEKTHRGLFFTTRDPGIFEKAREVYSKRLDIQ